MRVFEFPSNNVKCSYCKFQSVPKSMHRHLETDHATIFAGTTFTASDHYEVNFESPTYDYYYDGIRLNKKTNALSVRLKWDNENPEKEHFTRTFHPIEQFLDDPLLMEAI